MQQRPRHHFVPIAALFAPSALAFLAPTAACGPAAPAPVVATAVAATSASASASISAGVVAPPTPLAASVIGRFGEGSFAPRLARLSHTSASSAGAAGGVVVSAPRAATGRRWIAQALDAHDDATTDGKHELAEAPEDTSTWDFQPIGDGFVLAWTRPTDAGVQLLTLSLDAQGSPRGVPRVVTRSGEELVAVRLLALKALGADLPAALLTYGERTTLRGTVIASGAAFAVPIDALGVATTAAPPVKIADHLSAWHFTSVSVAPGAVALFSFVQRLAVDKASERRPDAGLSASLAGIAEDAPRSAKALLLSIKDRALVASDTLALTAGHALPKDKETDAKRSSAGDTALPDIQAVETSPGHALIVFADRRELDEHLFAAAVDVSGATAKLVVPAHRAVGPRGDQTLTDLVATGGGAVLMWEASSPRPIGEERRRYSLVRLNADGETTATPRSFWVAQDSEAPSIVARAEGGSDDVMVLTHGSKCVISSSESSAACLPREVRPYVLTLSGPTLDLARATMLDVGGDKGPLGGEALFAFDLSCVSGACSALVEAPGEPATIGLVRLPSGAAMTTAPRYVYQDLVAAVAMAPRLDAATTLGRESQFAGLRATRTAGGGSAAAWITYAAEDADESKPDGKKRRERAAGAKVAVRVLDASGEPIGPTSVVSERAVSKGNVAIAWSAASGATGAASETRAEDKRQATAGGLVAYVSRAEGDEEVYTARIDAQGRRIGGPIRITHALGGASDVALVALPGADGSGTADAGYLVAWVDARKSAPAVYAARLDGSGQKIGVEAKVGGGVAGDVSSVALAVVGLGGSGPKVAIVWSDARADEATGFGDVYFTIVAGREPSKPLSPERVLLKTHLHSHNPTVVARGDGGALIGWIEDDPSAPEMLELTGADAWGAYISRIDGTGQVVMPPALLGIDSTLGKGVVSGLTADCTALLSSGSASAPACRLGLSWSTRQGVAILGAALQGSVLTPARIVWSYRGAATQEVSPSLVGASLLLCEDGMEKDDGRVRRLAIGW